MTQKDFFDISSSIKSGDKIRINIKKNANTFFEKEKTAVLTYSNWRYDEENVPVIEHVPTNWTEKMKIVWRYIFLWEEKVNSH